MVRIKGCEGNTRIGGMECSPALKCPADPLEDFSSKTGFDVIVVERCHHWNVEFTSPLDRASDEDWKGVVEMNNVKVHCKVLDGNDRIDASKESGWWQPNHFDAITYKSLLFMFRNVSTPYCSAVSTRNLLACNVFHVLISSSDVRPVPDVNEKNAQRCVHI